MKKQLQTQQTQKQQKQHKGMNRVEEASSVNDAFTVENSKPSQLQIAPEYIFQFLIPTSDILDIYQELALSLGFQMVEKQLFYATAIKKQKKKSFLDLFNCLNWWGIAPNVTAVKITILRNEKKMKKVGCLRGLVGSMQDSSKFIEKFKDKLRSMNIQQSSTSSLMKQEDYEFKSQSSNPFHLQACSDFMLHQILSSSRSQQFSISERMKKLLSDYFSSFKNVKESVQLLPSPMKNAITISQDISEEIKKLTFQKAQSQVIFPYFKISVEKYVFNKVEPLLKQIYFQKTKQSNKIFTEKREKIIRTLSIQQIFEEVLLTKELRIAKKMPQKAQLDLIFFRKYIQFCDIGCTELEKISPISNPRQKIKHCQMMYASLKSYFYQKLNKKYELSSMEDIIPVFIVVVLFSSVENLRMELTMMIDFLNEHGEDCDGEKRSIINLSESYNYIVRDWKI